MKILLISENNIDKSMAKVSKWNIECLTAFQRMHRPIRKLRDILQKCDFSFFGDLFIDISSKQISKYDLIIVNEGIFYFDVLKYVRKYNKHCRLVVFFLNSFCSMMGLYRKIFLQTVNKTNREAYRYEVWSFDHYDCKKYNLFYNNSYFIKLLPPPII